jgi:hypothetical protein
MSDDKLRRRLAGEAARLMFGGDEPAFYRARLKAAQRVAGRPVRRGELPTHREIREQFAELVRCGAEPAEYAVPSPECFQLYRSLLLPLEQVKENARTHPEGDALYHSLQVFELARNELPYDEEFLLAARLHDVGKAIDTQDHVGAALEALDGSITPRTAWLIEHHPEARALREGTLGARSHRRLAASEDFDELVLLEACDQAGRVCGAAVPDVDDALAYVRDLARECEEP